MSLRHGQATTLRSRLAGSYAPPGHRDGHVQGRRECDPKGWLGRGKWSLLALETSAADPLAGKGLAPVERIADGVLSQVPNRSSFGTCKLRGRFNQDFKSIDGGRTDNRIPL